MRSETPAARAVCSPEVAATPCSANSRIAWRELRIVFATPARRLPGLRLTEELDELEVRTTLTGGVTELPVTW